MEDETPRVSRAGIFKRKFSFNLFIRTIFHIINCVLFSVVGVWGVMMCIAIDGTKSTDPMLKDLKYLAAFFLTNWNFAFQTLFLMLSLAHDVLEWLDKQDSHFASVLRYWRDIVFSGLVVPFTLFVSSMFWCVYAVDRELVFPKVYDDVVPWWFNHCVHTNITVVILIETLLQARRRPRDFKKEIILVTVVDIAYAIVYYAIYFFTRRWLYKVFGVMTWWQVCLYQLLIWVSSYIFYFLQFPVNRLIHGDVDETDSIDGLNNQISTEQVMTNGTKEEKRVIDPNNVDAKDSAFTEKSQSLKYRSGKGQFEDSHL